ncbi:MAG TPA: hypothetical protein VK681_07525 [Reyranella sp.]|nr:hypothetical protein [Reyranella sp.]
MRDGIHFISGLSRSGFTPLATLPRQNPRFSAGMTSPVGSLFDAMLGATSQRNEVRGFAERSPPFDIAGIPRHANCETMDQGGAQQ